MVSKTFENFNSKLVATCKDLFYFLWNFSIFAVLSIYYIIEAIFLSLLPTSLTPLKDLSGKIILVTGGASGLGRQLVAKLTKLNATVVVWDRNKIALDETKSIIESTCPGKIYTYVVDLADKNLIYKMADIVKIEVGHVEILINNAGVVYGRTLLDLEDYMIENTFKVNILSHYWLIKAFLPDMLREKKGHIVTIASVSGLLGTYRCTDYSATKFAACGFHESFFQEIKTHGHDYIKTTLVCPYFINTGMFSGVKPRLLPMLEPSEVAEKIILAIRRDEVLCIIPSTFRYFAPMKFWLPAKVCWTLMHRVIQGPQSMMTFRGHLLDKNNNNLNFLK